LQRSTVGRLSQIGVPTLVILGEWDAPNPLEQLAAEIPGAKKVIMAETAHHPFMEKPTEFNQIVLDFLASLPSSQRGRLPGHIASIDRQGTASAILCLV
jgi:3-oxoadipate enol-lactonase